MFTGLKIFFIVSFNHKNKEGSSTLCTKRLKSENCPNLCFPSVWSNSFDLHFKSLFEEYNIMMFLWNENCSLCNWALLWLELSDKLRWRIPLRSCKTADTKKPTWLSHKRFILNTLNMLNISFCTAKTEI